MSVITVEHLVRTAAARWYARHGPRPYREDGWSSPDAEARHDQVLALGLHPDRQAVEALLGKGWVTSRCTLCYAASERVVHLALYDMPIDLCARCIEVAHQLLQASTDISPMVDIAADAIIGAGTRVWSFVVIGPDVVIGRDGMIGAATHIMTGARIGDEVRLQSHCFVCEGAMVGNRVFFGVGVKLSADKYPHVGKTDYVPVPPIIEDGVSLGTGAIILPGVRLGRGLHHWLGGRGHQVCPAGRDLGGCSCSAVTPSGA